MNRLFTVMMSSAMFASIASAAPVVTKVDKSAAGYQLLRDGKPYFIQGAGGDGDKPFLKACGGNSFRTWGADDIDAKLDEAERLGLTVTVGIWLGHERHGFDYANAKSVQDQFDRAKAAVQKYKDHPAVLMWSIGNEMEGYADGGNPNVWKAVDDIAKMIKELDPNHPTMTIIAEVGGERIPSIHKLCPNVDVVGINSYGGGPSVAERYRSSGGTKPFVITEFGPAGTWEVGKNEWGAPTELTSTAKADAYRATYEKSVLAEKGKLSLGSYAFTWGNKQEASATWFGLFMPGGERLEATDTLSELWGGTKPANRCPQIKPIEVAGGGKVDPSGTIKAKVDVVDPEGDALKIEWRLTKDYAEYQTGGDVQMSPPSYPEAIVKNGEKDVELKMPADGGAYWLYVIIHDGKGAAAVATASLYVNGPVAAPKATKAAVPFVLYADHQPMPYIPSGWMGKHDAIGQDEASTINPHSGTRCMKIEFRSPDNFGGIVWQDPVNDWGDKAGGYDLSAAKKLTFWARGEEGGEKVEFKFGVLGEDKKFSDSGSGTTGPLKLTKEWVQYTIDLAGRDLTRIKTGFVWTLAGQGKPVTFYLDDIKYE